MEISPQHLEELKLARHYLEQPPFAAKIADLIGSPIETAIRNLPSGWGEELTKVVNASLNQGLHWALATIDNEQRAPSPFWHSFASALSGGIGGFFGLAGLTLELPLSTVIMLRSIADIARSEGEDLSTLEGRLKCLEVFSFGGASKSDDHSETGYLATRCLLGRVVSEAASFVTKNGLGPAGAPILLRAISQFASRFQIQVTAKAAASLIPIIGAAGGATLNVMFSNYYQNMARGHFAFSRLERIYGSETVKEAYRELARDEEHAERMIIH